MADFRINTQPNRIVIKKVREDFWAVEWTFVNGYTHVQQCDTEHDARCVIRGFELGYEAARQVLGVAPHFNGQVEQVGGGQ